MDRVANLSFGAGECTVAPLFAPWSISRMECIRWSLVYNYGAQMKEKGTSIPGAR